MILSLLSIYQSYYSTSINSKEWEGEPKYGEIFLMREYFLLLGE